VTGACIVVGVLEHDLLLRLLAAKGRAYRGGGADGGSRFAGWGAV
jgi:hypothetical protein